LLVGDGAEATAGQRLTVEYTGWLYDPTQPEQKGREFSSSAGGAPFTFMLGAGEVIAGWDRGAAGMKVGGQRRLIIPPALAYGSAGAGGGVIPPNATLVFDIELLDVQG
jgi:FKBP-type peptidyl-prolyl cis-trans isomerase FkpA